MMELTSTEFVFLLPIVVLIYYLIPAKVRQYYLLLINLMFYATFGYKYILVIVLEAIVAWIATRKITNNEEEKGKDKKILIISVFLVTSILVFCKIGASISESIVAPLGISFYTLQTISYIIDVRRGDVTSEKNLIKLITFLSFFPTITSGPIYRYKDFIADHNKNTDSLRPEYDRIVNGIIYMIYGYFLKLVISARLGIAVDTVFENHRDIQYGWVMLSVTAMLYSIQILSDFAGYSAIVIGVAQILGYFIPENFTAPYFSLSVKEFWGRWHISFSSWLKDYIYIPLGGNRKGRVRKYLNIMITFIVSGLWHGVSGLHFLVWGAIHGLYQVVGDLTYGIRDKHVENLGIVKGSSFHYFLKRLLTFIFVTIAWIFFRTGVKDAVLFIYEMITTSGIVKAINGGFLAIGLSMGDWVILAFSLMLVYVVDRTQYNTGRRIDVVLASQGSAARCTAVIMISLVILIFGIYGDQHDASYFIYRNF